MNAVQKCKILNHLIEKNYQYHTEHMDSYRSRKTILTLFLVLQSLTNFFVHNGGSISLKWLKNEFDDSPNQRKN